MMRGFVFAVLAAVGLAGCTPEVQFSSAPPFSPEWCNAAKAFPRSGTHLQAVAQCHERGVQGFPADDNVTDYYYSEAARWGNVEAGAALARRGQPVPDDDLRREADARRAQERNTRIIADAIRPPSPPRPQHPSVLFPSGGPNIMPTSVSAPRTTPQRPPNPVVSPPRTSGGSSFSRSNTTTSVKRNCVNNVCRIERTICVDGRCTTTVSDR